MQSMKQEQISVKVVKVLYPKLNWEEIENGTEPRRGESVWYIIQTDLYICKGSMTWRPEPNERLLLTGQPTAYQGKIEFKFSAVIPDVPVNERDILKYACELTKGIGPVIEEKIWDSRGDDWRNVTDQDVPELGSMERLAMFQDTISKIDTEIEKTQAIGFILAHRGTLNMAGLSWEEWKSATVTIITEDPYRISDLPHYGFCHVDSSMRHAFGIGDDDPRRIRSGLEYAMKQLTERGSTAIDWHMLYAAAVKLLGEAHSSLIVSQFKAAMDQGKFKPFPLSRRVALARDYHYESEIYNYVK